MKTYQAIANRFRPKKFCEVYEQDAIIQTIKNAIQLNRVGHAYLFCGMRGTGKTTLARLFAKGVNCINLSQDQEPCNSCESCRGIDAGGFSLNVIEIDGASTRGIDDMRNLNETVSYAATRGRYKVYIIDEVHMLTKEAFNALLKTLEEPPKHVLFLFATTEAHKLPPTIVSRCQRFDLRPVQREKMLAKLESIGTQLNIEIEDGALNLISNYAEGSLRDAESLLDQLICYEEPPITKEHVTNLLGLLPATLFSALDKAAEECNLAFAFELSEIIFTQGHHLGHCLELLIAHYRNIALVNAGQKRDPEYEHSARYYVPDQVLEILDYLLDMQEKMQRTHFKQIHLEIIFLHILRSKNKIQIETLVARLEQLKKDFSGGDDAAQKSSAQTETKIDSPTLQRAPINLKKKIRHERVIHFASVELNGSIR